MQCFLYNSEIVNKLYACFCLFLCRLQHGDATLGLPPYPQAGNKANGVKGTHCNTCHHRYGEAQDRIQSHYQCHNGNHQHGTECSNGSPNASTQGLGVTDVDQITDLDSWQQCLVFTDTVVDNDRIVDSISQQGQNNCHEVGVDLKPAQYHAAVSNDQSGKQSQHSTNAGGPAADLLESECNVNDQDQCGKNSCHNTLCEEFVH